MSREVSYQERLGLAKELADRIEERKDDLLESAARDAGFSVKVTAIELDLAVRHLRTLEEEVPQVEGGIPYGVVGAIFPYDAPLVMLARLGGSALLSGNRLRFSFSSRTPQTARVVAEIARPFHFLDPIVGTDNRAFGQRCVEDEAVRVLFLSGSSSVGEAYRQNREAFDKLFFAGPGGMPAAMVLPGADAAAAAGFIARRAFVNGGQYCTTLKKALIHTNLYEEVRSRILQEVRALRVGDPRDPRTDIGPIRVERTRSAVRAALEACPPSAVLEGALDGEWIRPLVVELDEIPDWELFGPFLALKPFTDVDEAVREVTRTDYGFLLAYFGTPPAWARDAFVENFGMVHDNPDFTFTPLRLPFGGKKRSGWILERSAHGWVERDGAFLYSEELVKNRGRAAH